MKAKRKPVAPRLWIYDYKGCGCTDGPKPKSKMLRYCGKHGSDLQHAYLLPKEPRP